ncbi:MAG: aldolase [Rhodospirillales bacterium]
MTGMQGASQAAQVDDLDWPAVETARRDLAAALRLADRFGLGEGICNHFSFALPGRDDRFLLNPYGRHWAEMRASDILLLDGEGRVLAGEGEPETTALSIHGPIHSRCPEARAVLHTHMPYATSLTLLEDQRLLPLHQTALRFWGQVAYDESFAGLADSAEEGERLAGVLGDRQVLFMANHGVLVAGPSIAVAFDRLYYLERACRQQVEAMQTGRPLRAVSDNIAGLTAAQFAAMNDFGADHFSALKRLLDRDGADYAA